MKENHFRDYGDVRDGLVNKVANNIDFVPCIFILEKGSLLSGFVRTSRTYGRSILCIYETFHLNIMYPILNFV